MTRRRDERGPVFVAARPTRTYNYRLPAAGGFRYWELCLSLAEMEAGDRLGRFALDMLPEFIGRYASATADATASRPFTEGDPVPGMAVVATGLGKLIDVLGLTGGTIHAAQEVEFQRPVLVGERIYAEAELTGTSVRRDSRFATILTRFSDSSGKAVGNSLSTIVVPADTDTEENA